MRNKQTHNNTPNILKCSFKGGFKKAGVCCIFISFLFSFPFFLSAQETTVVGQIFDKHDKTPLSSINIFFKNTSIGTTSNDEGYFVIRSWETEQTLIFSSVGYKTKEIRVKLGEPAYLNVELEENNTILQDVFVYPGINPASEYLRKIRLMRKENDLMNYPDYAAESVEQDLILLSRHNNRQTNKKLYEQLQQGALSVSDSSLLVPLYMAENKYLITNKGRTELSKNIFSTPEVTDNLVAQILKGAEPEFNFYNNSVTIFGKSIISPLANVGNIYYNYYLTDSIGSGKEKQYEIHFYSKNKKNLAFDGTFRFDSTSLALTYIKAELPRNANINYVQNLIVKQEFDKLEGNRWTQKTNELTMNMTHDMFVDGTNAKSQLLIKQSSEINISDTITRQLDNFARSEYSAETLESKMQEFDNTPLMRTAKWLADVMLTSYAQIGLIDVGPLQQTIRLTDKEGFRLTVPLRTNEHLWKNISIGGYAGYGFRSNEIKYSAFGQFRMPTEKRRVFEIRYTDDYRRIDYNYNNYILRENVWHSTDTDIINTFFSFISTEKISPRKEWLFSYSNDWNRNIESKTSVRINKLFADECMPMSVNGIGLRSFTQQSITSATRFSFGEKKYEDHLQRIYIQNRNPVIYATFEAGRYNIDNAAGYYGKIIGSIKQNVRLDIGDWSYMAQAGQIFGRTPYPFLEIPQGNEPTGINFYQLNKMRYFEFGLDKYIQINNEFIFNGLIFNHIPLIKHLNFRELVALKVIVGDLSDRHREVLDFPNRNEYPSYLRKMKNPYVEGSIGMTNLFRIFTVQLNWRFTNIYEDISPWKVSAGFRLGF